MKKAIITILINLTITLCNSQSLPPYKNPNIPIETRVKDLLSRMTTEEKFWQLFMIPGDLDHSDSGQYKNGIFGFQVSASAQTNNAAGQMLNYNASENALLLTRKINNIQKYFLEKSRLGIPIIPFDEAVHGLVREGATMFPQAIALAATWDTALMKNVAFAIAMEARARGIRQVLSPVINIASDVRWGRVEETYGEDPFLSSQMAIAYISQFEQNGIVTTPKHFVANVGDGGRDSYPINFNDRLLEEIYFPPFKAAIEKGKARSIMTAYNSVDGSPATSSEWLLTKKLKQDWKFNGFIISDASAVGGANVLHYTSGNNSTSAAQAISSGLDVIFQTAYEHARLFNAPFLNNEIDQKRIDDAVSRVLKVKFELGLFEDPYVSENEVKNINIAAHKSLAKEAALKSIVLLKNDRNILPLSGKIHSITVIGTDAVEARLGGYSGPGNGKVNILDGIKQKLKGQAKVLYAEGCGIKTEEWKIIPSDYLHSVNGNSISQGLRGEYFNNITLEGSPFISRIDPDINFQWTFNSPVRGIRNDFYSVRWTGKLKSPKTGRYKIGLDGDDGFRLFINNKLVIDNWKKQTYTTKLIDYSFVQGKEYDIRIEFFEPSGNAHIKLIWNIGVNDNWREKINKAVIAAKQSDYTIIVAGIHEGEFQDRASLALPGHQEEMIRKIAALNKPVIVVLVGGSAITMTSWLDEIHAVLDVWYPGEEGGHAVADVIFGDYDPSGKLPVTFPISEAQLPLVYDHKPTGRGDDYYNLSGLPLFPFGFGLSYTNFTYRNIKIDKNPVRNTDYAFVHFTLTNTGTREGDEVVQLYIRDMVASVARPVIELKGFQRVHLRSGESKEISFAITPEMLTMLDKDLNPVIEPGDFRIMIGSSSRDLKLKETLTIK